MIKFCKENIQSYNMLKNNSSINNLDITNLCTINLHITNTTYFYQHQINIFYDEAIFLWLICTGAISFTSLTGF